MPTRPGGRTWGRRTRPCSKLIADRIATLRAADPGNERPVPIDLVTASGSGLDPDISPAAAAYQVAQGRSGARTFAGRRRGAGAEVH